MRYVITGSSGLIGTALQRSLAGDGHDVVRLVRRAAAREKSLGIGALRPIASSLMGLMSLSTWPARASAIGIGPGSTGTSS